MHTDLYRAIQWNHLPLYTIVEVLPIPKNAEIYSLVDAKYGFLQLKLYGKSSYLTALWSQCGKSRWLRTTFVIVSIPEEIQRYGHADNILLIVGRSQTEAEARMCHGGNSA